jgi:hypothetical protein
MTSRRIVLGPREVAMLLDGLDTLSGAWEDLDDYTAMKPPTGADQDRRDRLVRKLRLLVEGNVKEEGGR